MQGYCSGLILRRAFCCVLANFLTLNPEQFKCHEQGGEAGGNGEKGKRRKCIHTEDSFPFRLFPFFLLGSGIAQVVPAVVGDMPTSEWVRHISVRLCVQRKQTPGQ